MVDTPDFRVQNNFPMASVIQAAQLNADRQQRALQYGQQQLVQGLQSIGDIGQSILARRQAMAQAMAGAKLYANTPEGKEMLGTNQVPTGPNGQPVTASQIAQGGVGVAPQPNTPQIDLRTLATAFMGDKPSDVMKQMFEQHKLRVQSGLEAQKIASQAALTSAALGLKGQEVGINKSRIGVEQANNIRSQITSLEGKKAGIIKDFPDLTETITNNILPTSDKLKAAYKDYQDTQSQIDNYNRQLYGGQPTGDAQHLSTADLLAIVNQSSHP